MAVIRDQLAAYNERVKLFATSLNAIGLGLIGFAVLRPITQDMQQVTLAALWWSLMGLAFHAGAHYILGRMRKDVDHEPL